MSHTTLPLHPALLANLHRMGHRRPRPIQAKAVPGILARRDVIGLAHTGTGKTAAYASGIAHQLLTSSDASSEGRKGKLPRAARLRAIIICPTRELTVQGADEASRIVRGCGLRVACVYGKVGLRPQLEALSKGVDMLFGTPGRLRELVEEADVSYAYVRHLVLDEADRLLDMGFHPQIHWLLERMPDLSQRLLFSATMAPPVERLAREHLHDPMRIEVDRESETVEHVRQSLIRCADAGKMEALLQKVSDGVGKQRGGMVIFCRTRRRVGWVGTALRRNGLRAADVHGDRTPAQRRRALEAFEAGEIDVIVATDVAARGLHIERIRTVINYDLPLDPREYVHRVGRAGHGGSAGSAVTFLSAPDAERWERIVKTVQPEITAQEDLRATVRSGNDEQSPKRGARGTRSGSRTNSAAKKAGPSRRRGGSSGRGSERTGRSTNQAAGRTKRSASPKSDSVHDEPTPRSATRRRSNVGDKPRSGGRRASAPIKPGTKPGRGVRKEG